MSTLSRQYYKEVMQFVTSKEFKSLPQQAQNKIKQVAKETHSKLREAEDARQPIDERETRKARGVLTNALTDLYSGMASVGKSGASLAAWTADIAGAKDTAKTLDEAALSLGNVAERITPAADPESWVDFGAQSVAQNAPMLASAIIGGKALAGSKVLGGLVGAGRTALGVPGLPAAASGLSPSAASFASTLGVYGIPGARQANVEADYELTGKLREGKPFAEVMMAVPYAWVENTMGIGASKFMGNAAATNTITSMLQKNASKVSKALSKPLFELSNKSGVRGAVGAFARWIADNVVGEAGEEVIQGIMEEAMPFFTDLPVEQAIAKSLERINSPEVAEKLALQAKGGGIVGAVLGGGRTAVQSAVTAREAKLAERADAAAKIVADKAYSIMHESKDYASMITGLKRLHAQTEDQSHKDRITALIAMAHRKFSQQAQAELVMPPQEAQPNPIVESAASGAGEVIAGQRDKLTGLSARLDNALANKYSPQEDAGASLEVTPAVEQTAQDESLPKGKTIKDERLKLWMLKARTQSAIRKLQAINPSAPKAQTMDDAKEIDYNRASAIFEYALNPVDEQSGREAIEAFREYPIELQEMVRKDYEQAQPEAGKRLSVIPGTWKAKKEAAKQAELEAKQAKTAAKKARLAEQKRIANERAKAEATYPVESAKLQPNAVGVQIVDKSGQVPSTKKLVAAGDASRIEKKLLKPADVTLPAEGKTEAKFDASKEPSYNRTLKNIEILRKEGVQPYINITRRIDNRNVVYEAYTPEGKLLASSKKHIGSGSVEDKLSKRKDRYFSASIGSVEINKDDVFSMALFQQKQQEIDRQIQTYNGEADAMALGQPTVKQPEPAAEQKPAESVKQPATPFSKAKATAEVLSSLSTPGLEKFIADMQKQPGGLSVQEQSIVEEVKKLIESRQKKKPALEVFKGDDITFQFPDGRTEGAYVQDATPKTIDGIADQIYVKLDANGALRYLPKSWITKVKPSLMRQNKMDLAAIEAKREADTAKPEAWHTKLPETGKKTTGSTAEIINATSDDAFSALTADQKRAIMVGQDKFNLYVLPATNGNAGVIRFIPEDQKPANGWVQIPEFKETYRLGKMTEAQQKDLLTRAAWRAPILPAEQTRSSTAEKTKPEKAPAPKPAGKIEDFGEVLHGARKLYSQEFADSFKSSGDLATQPLSKSWPEPDYQKLIDAGMNAADVSLLRALRDTLPVKPRNAWRVKRWLEIAKKHKALAEKIVSGEMESKDFHQDGKLSEFLEIKNLMSLYEAAGHSASLAGAKIRYGTYFYQNGVKLDTPVDGYEVLMPGKNSWGGIGVGFGKTMTEAIADFKKKLPAFLSQKGATAKQRTTQFSVYQKMRGEGVGTYFIAYKTGGKLVELKKGFATGKEAQDYRNANRAELEAILKGKREVKPERRATNQPRVGKTRRAGDVTPQQFSDTFGFRGVQFGNWVEGDRRQVDLNEAYDALTDLAEVLGIPPQALSLNGELGLAFGSRGKGGKHPAAAHYEPDTVVINLTKKKGAGSLAHEWWHALDNYFGKGSRLATDNASDLRQAQTLDARQEIKDGFHTLMKVIHNSTNMKKRGEVRDETRGKPYWSTDVEISARSFESFILSKLSDSGISNDYLANIVSEEAYVASAEENDYPYLMKSEIPSVKDAFTSLFQTMEAEKTDKGVKLYSVEYLVAKYAARGLKQSAKIVRAGWDLFKSGATKFAAWAKGMLKQFGSKIGKQLRSMYADLQAFNKQIGRAGAVGSRDLKGKFKAPVVPAPVKVKAQKPAGVPKSFGVQSKDLKWVKDNPSRLRLVNDGKAVATLERNEKKQWLWKGTNRAFLNLGRAKSVVKQELFKLLKDGERQTARYKKAEMKANEQAEARKRKHDDYFSRPLKDNFDNPETKLTAAEKWQNFLHKVDETLFDRWAREKRLIAGAVSKKGLARIPESENFYQRHELLANRIAARTEDFKESYYRPLENSLVENGISYKAFNRFLRVMHAEERNDHIFQINPEFRQRAKEDPNNPTYAGSGITTKTAREEIARMKADGTFEKFYKAGKMFWDLNNKLLDIQVKYGILPADVRDVLKSKYKYYAPLKSMDEDSTHLDWRALGRRSESSDQLAHTVKAIESTFSYGENTRLRRAFAKFAINNPNPALYEIRRAVKKPYFDKNSGEVKYRLDMEAGRKDILYVKNGGNDLVFIIKDPDLLASLTNKNAAEVGALGHSLLFVNRWLGMVNTALAPEFMVANLIRDIQTAGISLSAEHSSDMAAEVLLGIPKAIKTVAQYKMGERNADGALYKEFLLQGGKIGYRDVYNLQETAKDLEKKIAEAQKGGAWFQSKTLLKDLGSFISDCNDVIESGTRLSTYMVARKAGMSKQASAALAAGVTINFQKKGTWGQAINATYLFGSASLGGTARVAAVVSRAAQTKNGRAIISGAIVYGFVNDLINRILGGIDPDDERSYYDKINASEKDMNYILMIPGTKGKYLKLPMPHGFNALPAMGRNLSAMMFGDQTLMQSVGNVANTLASSFSPTGYDERGLGHTVMPTALGLPVDLMTNSKFTGNRIKPEQNPFGAKLPQSQLVNKNTNKLLVVLTQALNRIAGGDERTPSGIPGTDISAADLQHVIESLTGGAGKIVSRSVDLLWRVGAAEEIPVGNVPFVRRLIGEAGDYSVYDSFIDRRDRVKRFEDARRKEDAAWVSDNRWLEVALRRYRAAEKTAKDIRNDSTLSDSDKRERVVLEQKRLNRDFDKIKAQYDKPGATIPVEPETKKNSRPGRPRPPKRPKRPRLPKLSRL